MSKNNTFGHPNPGVIERLEDLRVQIYRTDLHGEITIRVNRNGRMWIDKIWTDIIKELKI